MDGDIRDLLADDDDMFDPFEDEDETDELSELNGDVAQIGGVIGQPLQQEEPDQEKPSLPAEERIAQLLEHMPSQKRLLLRLVAFCKEQKSGEEMDAYTEELKQNCYSVYTPVVMRELLEEAGAIEYLPATTEELQEKCAAGLDNGAGESFVSNSKRVGSVNSNEIDSTEDGSNAVGGKGNTSAFSSDYLEASLAWNEGGVLERVNEAPIQHESLIEDGQEITLDYLEIEQARPSWWLATPAGLAAVSALDDLGATRELLAKEPEYLDIYHQILDFCAQEEFGRSPKEIDNLVNNSPLLQEPRRYSGYFVSRLERQGALEWRSGWCITAAGTTIMNEYATKASEKEADHVAGD